MKKQIRFGKSIIQYSIVKSKRRKTSEIQVDDKGVELRVPISKTNLQIKNIMEEKKRWVYNKQLEFANRKKLKKIRTKPKTVKYLENRTWKLASKLGFLPSKVVVKSLKSRWGSAGKTGIITINEKLIKAPPRLVDYIIIHELCHLKIKDHSFRYWNLVRKYCPKYEERKNELEIISKTIL